MVQIATTIEQSKKLEELGISTDTSDMSIWRQTKDWKGRPIERKIALSTVGMYVIEDQSIYANNKGEKECGYELELYSNLSIDEKSLETQRFDTEDEAKQAAEADYRLRLSYHLNHIKDWYERHYGL